VAKIWLPTHNYSAFKRRFLTSYVNLSVIFTNFLANQNPGERPLGALVIIFGKLS